MFLYLLTYKNISWISGVEKYFSGISHRENLEKHPYYFLWNYKLMQVTSLVIVQGDYKGIAPL